MNNFLLLVFILFTINLNISAQPAEKKDTFSVYALEDQFEDDPYFWSYSKEIGINFTPLVSKFVPFNLGQNDAGLIGLKWKKYYSKRAFRINFGADIRSESIDDNSVFAYLAFGVETRHPITKDKKIAYTSAWDLFFSAEGEDGNPIIGVSKSYGFEYHFSKRLFISTEAALQIGRPLDDFEEGIIINFQLPTAIFVNIRLY